MKLSEFLLLVTLKTTKNLRICCWRQLAFVWIIRFSLQQFSLRDQSCIDYFPIYHASQEWPSDNWKRNERTIKISLQLFFQHCFQVQSFDSCWTVPISVSYNIFFVSYKDTELYRCWLPVKQLVKLQSESLASVEAAAVEYTATMTARAVCSGLLKGASNSTLNKLPWDSHL